MSLSPSQGAGTTVHASPRLPVELTEICLRVFARNAKDHGPRDAPQQIGTLRLVSRHFRDVLTRELFDRFSLRLHPWNERLMYFPCLITQNPDIVKHIRHLTLIFQATESNPLFDPGSASEALQHLSSAPFTTLTISGLDEELELPPLIENDLFSLRCNPELQRLEISGTEIPPFLVCGHIGSTRLKAIEISSEQPSLPLDSQFEPIPHTSFNEDSILADAFQPFAELQSLCVPYLADVPKYFPLHDFGSNYYASNNRITFALPALKELRIGNPQEFIDSNRDLPVLGTLLSRAPNLESLCLTRGFLEQEFDPGMTPLIEQLPTLQKLTRLELSCRYTETGAEVSTMYKVITSCLPLPSLKTLRISLFWMLPNADAARGVLYSSKIWKKLQELILHPDFSTLSRFELFVAVSVCIPYFPPGDGEVSALAESLRKFYSESLRGTLDVEVTMVVERHKYQILA